VSIGPDAVGQAVRFVGHFGQRRWRCFAP
jgi:hypothetical protein